GDFLVAIKKVQQLFADAVDQVSANFRVTELVLGLRFENRVLQPDSYGADHAFADVVALELFFAVLVNGFEQAFAESAELRATIPGLLAVYERIKRFAEPAVAVGKTEFEGFFRIMQRRVNGLAAVSRQIFHHEIEQTVAGLKDLTVVNQLQAGVEIAVMP